MPQHLVDVVVEVEAGVVAIVEYARELRVSRRRPEDERNQGKERDNKDQSPAPRHQATRMNGPDPRGGKQLEALAATFGKLSARFARNPETSNREDISAELLVERGK